MESDPEGRSRMPLKIEITNSIVMQNNILANETERESRPTIYSDLSADDQTFEMIKNLQEELAIERRSTRRLEEQLLKSQQRWNFFFSQYEGMLKAQLDPIFDQVDIILGKLIGDSSFGFRCVFVVS
jgi:hypothetical protein